MSYLKVLIDTTNIGTSSELDRLSSYDRQESIEALIKLLEGLKAGSKETTSTVTLSVDKLPVQSSAIVTFSGEVSVDDTVTVNGVVFTAKASPGTEMYQFQAHATAATAAASFVAKYNAATSVKVVNITASNADGVITLTCDEPGAAGNGNVVAKSGTNIAITNDFGSTGHVGTDGTGYDFSF